MLGALVFAGFFAAAAWAAVGPSFQRRRRWFLSLFVVGLFVAGIAGISVHPFFSWHLYGAERTDQLTFHEVLVEDADGDRVTYDAAAAPPTLQTPIRRYGTYLVSTPPDDRTTDLACFLLERANAHRNGTLSGGGAWDGWRFPEHQFHIHWTPQDLEGVGPLERLVVARVTVKLDGDASVASRTSTDEWSLPDDACS